MNWMWDFARQAAEQGLIFSLVVMAVYLSSRLIRFDDLTVEGSFATGGAVSALALTAGFNGWLSLLLAITCGAIAGTATALLHMRLGLNKLISGVCVTTALFTINLNLAGANRSIGNNAVFADISQEAVCLLLASISLTIWIVVRWLLRTEVGALIRASGENPAAVIGFGKSPNIYKTIALAVSNSLTALAGALFVHWTGFFSITGSVGTLVIALSGLILGGLFSSGFGWGLIAGPALYQTAFAITLLIGIHPSWNNFIKAVLVICLLQLRKKHHAFA